jgi:hypothetical protein
MTDTACEPCEVWFLIEGDTIPFRITASSDISIGELKHRLKKEAENILMQVLMGDT